MRFARLVLIVFALPVLAGCTGSGGGATPGATSAPAASAPAAASVSTPATPGAPATLQPAPEITVQPGFHVAIYASGLDKPTAMAWRDDGRLYLTQGTKVVLVEAGSASPEQMVGQLDTPLGLAWIGQQLFIAEQGKVTRVDFSLRPAQSRTIVDNLPFKLHQQDNIVAGPDGRLYLGSGSTCDVCNEPDPRSAAILSFRPDGSDLKVVATGLRNPFGLAFQPGSGKLYATVNGQDALDGPAGPEPADMLVRIDGGAFYGWPRCWPSAQEIKLKGDCAGVAAPAAYLTPHSSADGFAFYTGASFPAEYAGNAFIAQWGTYAEGTPYGRNLVRVRLDADGTAPIDHVSVFATGFDHPIAVTVDAAGALLVADWSRGVIYRIQADGKP